VRAVFQRVKKASVSVGGQEVASQGKGAMVLLAVGKEDTEKDAHYMAEKIAGLRVFPDSEGKMNLSLLDIGGEVLLISQFTLYGDVKKGKRPGFDGAAAPELGERLYLLTAEALNRLGVTTRTGVFGAYMQVELVNDGPVTILISSKKEF
jgi:D-tyrosyl-tRNA(Tyr) deacylase